MVKTQGGFLANILQTYRIEDIWSTPFLSRPSLRGLLLIGERYVYGMMHGEAIDHDVGLETDFEIV